MLTPLLEYLRLLLSSPGVVSSQILAMSTSVLSFYFLNVLLQFTPNAKHVHHGPRGWEGLTSVSPHRTSSQAGGSLWREISDYRFYAQQLPQFRASKSCCPHSVQIPLD